MIPEIKGRPSDHYRLFCIIDSLGSSVDVKLNPWCDELIGMLDAHYNKDLNCIYFKTEEDLAFFKLSTPTD
jgi:hypothetical protein